jgi:hypothetical protein
VNGALTSVQNAIPRTSRGRNSLTKNYRDALRSAVPVD